MDLAGSFLGRTLLVDMSEYGISKVRYHLVTPYEYTSEHEVNFSLSA